MNLGQAFMPPRNVVHFMRNRGVENTAKEVQKIYDDKGYSSALDAHELVNRLEERKFYSDFDTVCLLCLSCCLLLV